MENKQRNTKIRRTLKAIFITLAKAMYHHGDDTTPWYCKMNRLGDWAME